MAADLLPRAYVGHPRWRGPVAIDRPCPACGAGPGTPCVKAKSGGTDYGRGSNGKIAAKWPHIERRRP